MKNIALLSHNLASGGAEHIVSHWSKLLAHYYNVYIIIFEDDVHYDYGGTLVNLNVATKKGIINKILRLLTKKKRLQSTIKKFDLDLVISFCTSGNLSNFLGRGKCKKAYSIRGFNDFIEYNILYKIILKFRKSDLIIVQTEFLKQFMLNKFGQQYADRIYVIGNCFDIADIREKAKEEVSVEYEALFENHDVIVNVASFKHAKNHWGLIKSFRLLEQENPNVKLLFIGANGELENNIKEMVANSGLEGKVIFAGIQKNPYKFVARSKIFVLPSLSEGIPNALIEAMALGVPVIATDCRTGPREILIDNPNLHEITDEIEYGNYGILVKPFTNEVNYDIMKYSKDCIILKDAMSILISDSVLYAKYAELSAIRAESYDISLYKESLHKLIENIVLDKK